MMNDGFVALRSFHERAIAGGKAFDPFDELVRYESMLPHDFFSIP